MNRLKPIVSNWLISPTAFSNSVWAAAPKKLFGLHAQGLSMVLLYFCFSTVCAQHNWIRTHSDTHVDLSGVLAQGVGYWITHLNGSVATFELPAGSTQTALASFDPFPRVNIIFYGKISRYIDVIHGNMFPLIDIVMFSKKPVTYFY